MPFILQDVDRICASLKDYSLRDDLIVNLFRLETKYGSSYVTSVLGVLEQIESLSGNISIKETQFALNSIDYNIGSSQLATGVTVGNLKKVGAIEYYDSKPYTSYVLTLNEMKSQLSDFIAELFKLLEIKKNDCSRKLIR